MDCGQPQRLDALGKMGAEHRDALARLFDMDNALGEIEPSP
jgi:hypothetical protein